MEEVSLLQTEKIHFRHHQFSNRSFLHRHNLTIQDGESVFQELRSFHLGAVGSLMDALATVESLSDTELARLRLPGMTEKMTNDELASVVEDRFRAWTRAELSSALWEPTFYDSDGEGTQARSLTHFRAKVNLLESSLTYGDLEAATTVALDLAAQKAKIQFDVPAILAQVQDEMEDFRAEDDSIGGYRAPAKAFIDPMADLKERKPGSTGLFPASDNLKSIRQKSRGPSILGKTYDTETKGSREHPVKTELTKLEEAIARGSLEDAKVYAGRLASRRLKISAKTVMGDMKHKIRCGQCLWPIKVFAGFFKDKFCSAAAHMVNSFLPPGCEDCDGEFEAWCIKEQPSCMESPPAGKEGTGEFECEGRCLNKVQCLNRGCCEWKVGNSGKAAAECVSAVEDKVCSVRPQHQRKCQLGPEDNPCLNMGRPTGFYPTCSCSCPAGRNGTHCEGSVPMPASTPNLTNSSLPR